MFTEEGFDFDAALQAIEDSDLGQVAKTAARTALECARNAPELLPVALERVRGLLGLDPAE